MDAQAAGTARVSVGGPLVKVDGVCRSYHKGGGHDLLVLDRVSLALRPNEIVSLLGRSVAASPRCCGSSQVLFPRPAVP